jgi:hypothetical protein
MGQYSVSTVSPFPIAVTTPTKFGGRSNHHSQLYKRSQAAPSGRELRRRDHPRCEGSRKEHDPLKLRRTLRGSV